MKNEEEEKGKEERQRKERKTMAKERGEEVGFLFLLFVFSCLFFSSSFLGEEKGEREGCLFVFYREEEPDQESFFSRYSYENLNSDFLRWHQPVS